MTKRIRLSFLSLLTMTALGGCTVKNNEAALHCLKTATVNAVSDPMTWAPLAGAGVLYATPYDEKITDYFIAHPWTGEEDNGERARDVNTFLTLGTAVLVPEERWQERGRRVVVELVTIRIARVSSSILEANIKKETPDGRNEYAIGSHHAVSPFAGSALTRRNVEGMGLPPWAGYGIVGASYLSAGASALSRVEDGGHSFADQLVNASIGNMIGLFFHDLFLLDKRTAIQASLGREQAYVGIRFTY